MDNEAYLFNLEDYPSIDPAKKYRNIKTPIWTKNKAEFIARYLKAFTYVTKHGTYIDAFAGPQHEESRDESWSAKLVMENEPAWFRNFCLFDKNPQQVSHLKKLREVYLSRHDDKPKRTVNIISGDCNLKLPEYLNDNPIREKEASFCLLDQRTAECDWATVKAVAEHKSGNKVNKIEIFYFLAQGWLNRTFKSWTKSVDERYLKWWGKDDLMDFLKLGSHDRGRAMAERFMSELGYKYAVPFPIQQEGERGRIMFWMVHATDHDRATDLMLQAYKYIGAGGGLE